MSSRVRHVADGAGSVGNTERIALAPSERLTFLRELQTVVAMKKMSFVLIGALSLAAIGCKKKGASGDADCARAINHSMELSKAEMQKMGTDDAMMKKMVDLGIQRCTEDKWPDAALKCMVDAKTMSDAQACYGKLSQEQQDKMNKAAMELATPAAGSDSGEGSAAGGSAAGSDTGSAAGSAAAGSDAAGSGSAAPN